jgi:hypothetical protein
MKRTLRFVGSLPVCIILFALFVCLTKMTGWSFKSLIFGPRDEHISSSSRRHPPAPPDGQVIAAFKEKASWLAEYKMLNEALDRAAGNLFCSYRSGLGGTSTVNLRLERGPGNGLTLIIDSPPEAFKHLDEKTGRVVPDDYRTTSRFRDTDLDGVPDEALIEPSGEPLYAETLTRDGYILVRDSAEHTAFFAQWTVGMYIATNHFLHGKALP